MSSLRGVLRFLEVYLWRRVEGYCVPRRFEPEGRGANAEVGQEGSAGSNRQKPALCRRGVHRNDIGPSVHRFDPADRCDSNDLPAPRVSRSFQCHFCGHRRGDALTADRGILQPCSRQRRIRSICRRRCDLRRCWRRPALRISLLMFFEGGLSVLAELATFYCSASMTALRVVDGRMTASVRASSGR